MPTPFPHQLTGAQFLANNTAALLADEPRVGKTGTSIIACDLVFARKILVVTTATARAQWAAAFREWQGIDRSVTAVYRANIHPDTDVVITAWSVIHRQTVLRKREDWDVIILDESHYAKSPDAKRTEAVFGVGGVAFNGKRVWCLTGTPIPNAPNDLWPMLNALAEDRIDGMSYNAFMRRYCVLKKKYVGGQWIEYAIKGQNEAELAERLKGFWLRRTQQDVGIRRPIFSVFPLHSDGIPQITAEQKEHFLALLEAEEDDAGFASLRRTTGVLKAHAVADAVKEAFESGLDKVVLMAWHTDVIDILRRELSAYGVVGIDGRTMAHSRQPQVDLFQHGDARVFIGNIVAAGEAIDLSASAELWFVEASLVPKDMAQAAMRITNHSQKRQALVRVCALENSIDEALMRILTRKVETIRNIMEEN